MTTPVAYIAGPMRGIAEYNFPAFFTAEALLLDEGYTTINPARRDDEGGFAWRGTTGFENLADLGFDLSAALAWDLDKIAREADVVVVLPGWEDSSGAKSEVATAEALGKPVLTLDQALGKAVTPSPLEQVHALLTSLGAPVVDIEREHSVVPDLTARQAEVLGHMAEGLTYAECAKRMDVALSTAVTHGTLALRALGYGSRSDWEGNGSPTTVKRTLKPAAQRDASALSLGVERAQSLLDGEVRMTSDSGGAKGAKLARFDMIPADALWELAEQFGKGAIKYEPVNGLDNWRNGYGWSLSYGAALRHLVAALGGEDIDEETGSKHLAAVAWHCLTLIHHMNTPGMAERFDDRQDVVQRRVQATV